MSVVTGSEIPGTTSERAPGAARRLGYLISLAINGALLYLINVAPGWQAVSWVTPAAADVVWVVNLSLSVSLTLNVLYVLADPPWFRALGEAVSAALAAVVAGVLLRAFPFDFTGWDVNWAPMIVIVLVVALVGSAIGLIVNIVKFVRAVRHSGR